MILGFCWAATLPESNAAAAIETRGYFIISNNSKVVL
jgi:hypothetical protein